MSRPGKRIVKYGSVKRRSSLKGGRSGYKKTNKNYSKTDWTANTAVGVIQRAKGSLLTKTQAMKIKTQNPLPYKLFCKFNYSNTEILTATNGNTATVTQYRLNSLYDPYYTGAGTQPYQFDQLNTIYGIYKVHGAKVKVTFFDPSTDGFMVGYRIRASTNTTTTNAKNVRLLGTMSNTAMKTLNNSGEQQRTFSGYVPIHKIFGITKGQYSNELAYSSAVGDNPSADALLEIFVIDMNNNIDKTVKMTVSIQYLSQLYGLISPGES